MNKKILIGSLLVLTLLLLMPSIPAIQQKTIEDAIQYSIEKQLTITEIKGILKEEQLPKHPILFLIVWIIASFRVSRALFLYDKSAEWIYEGGWHGPYLEIKHPLLFLRFLMLIFTIEIWFGFWEGISYLLDWDWYF